jgi:bis(5'-nucleosidyl)-tetraphosphatase
MIQQRSAGIVTFINKDDKIVYLILHYLSGHWDFPKGKLEPNETMIEAAERELHEETGLTARILPGFEKSLTYKFKERGVLIQKTVSFFIGKTELAPVTLSREHKDYAWLTYQEAHQRLTYKNAQEILEQADQFIISQYIK